MAADKELASSPSGPASPKSEAPSADAEESAVAARSDDAASLSCCWLLELETQVRYKERLLKSQLERVSQSLQNLNDAAAMTKRLRQAREAYRLAATRVLECQLPALHH
jgi:hypothetical protein